MNRIPILLIHEDRLTQKSLYELLCRSGYKVKIANSVHESLPYLDIDPCPIVLTDVNGAGGNELLEIIKEKACATEVIILTSYGNIEAAVESIKLGAFDYLVRPVEDEKILCAIERALSKRSAKQAKPIPVKDLPAKTTTYHGFLFIPSTSHEGREGARFLSEDKHVSPKLPPNRASSFHHTRLSRYL